MISVKNLSFAYEKEWILKDVDLDLDPSAKTSILGPNGTGKSTFLNLLAGRLSPQKGIVTYNETKVQDISKRILAKKISYIPQFHNPAFNFKVIDVVLMGRTSHLSYFSSPKREDYKIAHLYLEEMGILHLKNKYYTEISGGERQLVLICSALCQEAETIILDEPTSHLDFGNSYLLIERLKKLNKEKKVGIIITTHFPDHAFQMGGECLILKDEKVLAKGSVEKVLTEVHLSQIYQVPITIKTVENKKICIIDS